MLQYGHRRDQLYTLFCQSTDTFPLTLPGNTQIPIGSDLYVTDQFMHYTWAGTAGWVPLAEDVVEVPVYNPLLTQMMDLMTQQVECLAEILGNLQLLNMTLGAAPTDAPVDLTTSFSTMVQ